MLQRTHSCHEDKIQTASCSQRCVSLCKNRDQHERLQRGETRTVQVDIKKRVAKDVYMRIWHSNMPLKS